MKYKANAVAAALRSRPARREQDGDHAAGLLPPPEPDQEPVV